MKTNATILEECVKTKSEPSWGIADVTGSIGLWHYYKPYGEKFLPPPIPYFPVGEKLEICVGENTTKDKGLQFKVFVDKDIENQSDLMLEIMMGGDKTFRGGAYSTHTLTHDMAHGYYLYKTSTYVDGIWYSFTNSEWGYLSAWGKLFYGYTERFWRARLVSGDYKSAWSELVSFSISPRKAETNVAMYDEDGNLSEQTNEAGFWVSGGTYYGYGI